MTITQLDEQTRSTTLPPAPARRSVRPRRSRLVVAAVVAALLTSTLVGAAVLPVPYIAMRPGSARPVTEQVLVEGAPSYPPEASVAYTTVNLRSPTLLEAIVGWLDPEVDVLPEERLRGNRSAEENRRYNAQLMDASKLVAITVALRQLGYEVTITTSGTIVREIVEDTPAAEVLEPDDVIVAVDGQPVDEPGEIGDLLQVGGPGAEHVLTIERPAGSRERVEVRVRTVPAPDDPERAIVGILTEDRISEFDFPVDVTIDSGTVGGPSAGLAFTLGLIDLLTEGELTGGHRVAATGTISLDGRVGTVGGVVQKAVAVREAGYEVFLVPSLEVDEAEAVLGDDVLVIGVDTLAAALEALGSLGGNARSIAQADVRTDP